MSININNVQCPLPQLDFDTITLGHGSGGKLTSILLNAGVFNLLKNEELDKQHDGAILNLQGRTAFSTDSFVISPVFFPGGNIGELAVNGTVNDVAMCGGNPQYLSLSFIIEEGLAMQEFWEILQSIKQACEEAGVQVVTGDTKVVERGKGDKIFINTTGIGSIHPQADIRVDRVKKGDKILLNSAIANHGIAIMSLREGLEFETSIESDTRPLNKVVQKALDKFGSDIHLLRDPTRGGLATVLTEIAEQSQLGIDIFEEGLVIEEAVEGACALLGLDPLYVANEGVFISIVAPEIADEYLNLLKDFPGGHAASCIGEVGEEHPRQVVFNSQIGGKRVVNRLVGDQLPRIC